MTSTYFKELYDSAESGVVTAAVPSGTYDVVVTGARSNVKSNQIWLTLSVLNGADAGKSSDVSLYFPKEGDAQGARVFFMRKVNGFLAYPDVKAAFQAADNAPDLESGFTHIAQALEGKQVSAEITLRSEGEYAGQNDLRATKPLSSTPAGIHLQTPPQQQPQQVPQSAPASEAAVSPAAPF